MFGVLDRLYVLKKRDVTHEDVDWKPLVTTYDDSNESWYCFVPKIVMNNERIMGGIPPKQGKIVVYKLAC